MDATIDEFEAAMAVTEQESQEVIQRRIRDAAAPIIGRLSKLASEAMTKRKEIERRWIEDMCQYSGVRDVNERRNDGKQSVAEDAGSQVFVNITRPKTNRTEGRICDILFPADDKNWGITPTPIPDLSVVARKGMEEAKRAVEEANRLEATQDPSATSPDGLTAPEQIQKGEELGTEAIQAQDQLDEAMRRSELMGMQIDDQLVESRYAQRARDAIGWACKIGVGVLKGPVIIDRASTRWGKGEDGQYQLGQQNGDPQPSVECTSPWAFFPDPSATSIEDAEYVLERHLPSKRELSKMALRLSFDKGAVGELLDQGPGKGSSEDLQFLSDIRLLTGETTQVTDRYIVWEYHGQLTVGEIATLMRAAGGEEADAAATDYEDNADPLEDRMVIAWFCEGHLLKLSEHYPMDSQSLVYSVFSLEKGSASILGAIGVPRMMRDSQMALNAAWRMMMDNAALSVAPQVLMDTSSVKPADGSWVMRPRKVWNWDTTNGAQKPFETFNIPVNQEQIAGIITLAQSFIDEETSMPRLTEGAANMGENAGVMSTVGGFAMLLNAAGVNIRRIVKNWDDDVTTGLITRFFHWNMQMSQREEIKGDMEIEARGSSVLLVRETQAANLSALTSNWSVHPILGPMIKPYGLARLTLQALAISPNDVLISEDDFKQKVEGMGAEEAPPEDPQWQMRLQIAQMDTDAKLKVAEMDREIAMLRLAETSKLSLEKIAADLQKTRAKLDSDERKLAVELGSEEAAAREARAIGRLPGGSGGAISLGSESP